MPDMTVDERMNALLQADLDHRERRNMQSEAHPPTPARDRSQPWTAEQVLQKLERSNIFVERALLYLYAQQTPGEQAAGSNCVGFNQFDARYLTSCAVQCIANRDNRNSRFHAEGSRLSARQRAVVRGKLRKYVRQLVNYANRNRPGA